MTEPSTYETGADLIRGFFDDAAVFPPGNAPLGEAVSAHNGYRTTWFSDAVGPLILPDTALNGLGEMLEPGVPLEVTMTVRGGLVDVPGVLARVSELPVALRAIELPLGVEQSEVRGAVASLASLLPEGVDAFVEVPREANPRELLEALVAHGVYAKFRTGGLRQELYPDDAELAESLGAAVAAGVPFKATAGLHHPLRNIDPETGLDQHGFLNLLLAVDALIRDADTAEVQNFLAERDAVAIVAAVRALDPARLARARESFVSFGTCSMTDPVEDLIGLGLIARP
jgi:hypothetical protein